MRIRRRMAAVAAEEEKGRPLVSKIASFSEWLLRSSIVWGGIACMGLYALLKQDVVDSPLLDRYLLGHPIEVATTVLFCVAMAALALRAASLLPQFLALEKIPLEAAPAGGQSVDEATELLRRLDSVPALYRDSYVIQRLRAAISYVRRKDSAETLERHLHHLHDLDFERMSSGYALTRVIVWAIPSLGFLGTVIGIAAAIGHLSFEGDTLIESLKQVIPPLTSAFDTTTLSLALLFPIMFAKYAVERVETRLLEQVGNRVEQELVGRFFEYGSANDPQVAAVRRMSEQVVRAVEAMSVRHGQVLSETLEDSHRHWADVATATGKLLDESLQATFQDSLNAHAQSLASTATQQTTALENVLRSQTEALQTAIERQIELLNSGVQRNVNAIENGVVNRLSLVDDVFTKHVSELEQLVTQQVDFLGLAVQSQTEQVQEAAADLTSRLRDGLERMAELLVEALHQHGATLTRSEVELAQENRRHLSEVEAALGEAMVLSADRQEKLITQSEKLLQEMQATLVNAADATVEQQQQLLKQGEILLRVVDATGQVKRLEETLNQNLATLGKSHNFEETLLSLSATVQLLSARLGREPLAVAPVGIDPPSSSSSQAA